jgi:hypothetical protein
LVPFPVAFFVVSLGSHKSLLLLNYILVSKHLVKEIAFRIRFSFPSKK